MGVKSQGKLQNDCSQAGSHGGVAGDTSNRSGNKAARERLTSAVLILSCSMSVQQVSFAATIDVLRQHVPEKLIHPRVGIVCGSGLSTLASSLREQVLVSYDTIPGFATSTGISFLTG